MVEDAARVTVPLQNSKVVTAKLPILTTPFTIPKYVNATLEIDEVGVGAAVRFRLPVPDTVPAVSTTVLSVAVVATARKSVPIVKVSPLATSVPALSLNEPDPAMSTLVVMVCDAPSVTERVPSTMKRGLPAWIPKLNVLKMLNVAPLAIWN